MKKHNNAELLPHPSTPVAGFRWLGPSKTLPRPDLKTPSPTPRAGLTAVLLIAAALLPLTAALGVQAANRPNIILCMSDDQGWGDIGFNNPAMKTPNLDEMARSGIRFDRFYSGSPMCSPSRASCLTGRTPNRYHCYDWGHDLPLRETTVAEVVQQAGYATAHFGKWHLGGIPNADGGSGRGVPPSVDSKPRHPGNQGFDYWFSAGNWYKNGFPAGTLYRNGVDAGQIEGDTSEILMEEALKWIRDQAQEDKPFLAVIWFPSPHSINATRSWSALPKDRALFEEHGKLADFYGEMFALDRAMGRLRDELRMLGIRDNTMLWFNGDNGSLEETMIESKLSGAKGTLLEGGILVPCLLEWPARIRQPFRTQVPASTMDFYPTILDALDLEPPAGQPEPIDGMSLLPLIEGRMERRPMPIPFEFWANGKRGTRRIGVRYEAALIDNQYKLLRDPKDGGSQDALFDLSRDPGEQHDISRDEPEIFARMVKQLDEWQRSVAKSRAEYPSSIATEATP